MEIVVLSSSGEFIYRTQAATSITGEYHVTIKDTRTYYVGVHNPSSTSVNISGWLEIEACEPHMPGHWLRPFLRLVDTPLGLKMAPIGIVAYGVINASGTYYAYTIKTNAVMGKVYIPPGVMASDYSKSGRYYGNAFSIQLNAYVVVELANGQTQYYWVQNGIGLMKGALWVGTNVWNETTPSRSHLSPSAIRGNGKVSDGEVYIAGMPGTSSGSVPFGWVTLEITAGVSGGSVVVRLYANGQNYDTVTITPPAPATSAYIIIAPKDAPHGSPLNLELVFAGVGGGDPYAVLQSGSLQLQLYVNINGTWVPPPSAWTVGALTYEKSYASVSSSGIGSAVVSPGAPNIAQLWTITVVVGPIGAVATTDTDLTRYFPPLVYSGSGTRLVLKKVYINGQPATDLSHVPVGSLVVGDYVKQYYVVVRAPGNITAGWFNAGSTLAIQHAIYFGNGTRLANPSPAHIAVDRPLNVTVSYTKQYYVEVRTYGNTTAGWLDEGSAIVINARPVVNLGNKTRLVRPTANGAPLPLALRVDKPLNVVVSYVKQYLVSFTDIFGSAFVWVDAGSQVTVNATARWVNSTYFKPAYLLVNGVVKPLGPVSVSMPVDIYIAYMAEANVSTVQLGLPALYVSAELTCGGKTAQTSALLASALKLALEDPPTYSCRLNPPTMVPLTPVVAVAVAVPTAIAILRKKKK